MPLSCIPRLVWECQGRNCGLHPGMQADRPSTPPSLGSHPGRLSLNPISPLTPLAGLQTPRLPPPPHPHRPPSLQDYVRRVTGARERAYSSRPGRVHPARSGRLPPLPQAACGPEGAPDLSGCLGPGPAAGWGRGAPAGAVSAEGRASLWVSGALRGCVTLPSCFQIFVCPRHGWEVCRHLVLLS